MARVEITIRDARGEKVETGPAEQIHELKWTYTTTRDHPGADSAAGTTATVLVTVTDHPGNSVEQRVEKRFE